MLMLPISVPAEFENLIYLSVLRVAAGMVTVIPAAFVEVPAEVMPVDDTLSPEPAVLILFAFMTIAFTVVELEVTSKAAPGLVVPIPTFAVLVSTYN